MRNEHEGILATYCEAMEELCTAKQYGATEHLVELTLELTKKIGFFEDRLITSLNYCAEICIDEGKYAHAERILRSALQTSQSLPLNAGGSPGKTRSALVQLLRRVQRPVEAACIESEDWFTQAELPGRATR